MGLRSGSDPATPHLSLNMSVGKRIELNLKSTIAMLALMKRPKSFIVDNINLLVQMMKLLKRLRIVYFVEKLNKKICKKKFAPSTGRPVERLFFCYWTSSRKTFY